MGIQIDYSGLRFASKPSEREFRSRFRDGGRLGRWAMLFACLGLVLSRPLIDAALLGTPASLIADWNRWLHWLVLPPALCCACSLLYKPWYPASTPASFALAATGLAYTALLAVALGRVSQDQPLTGLALCPLLFCVLVRARLLAGLLMAVLTLAVGTLTYHAASETFGIREYLVFACLCIIAVVASLSVELTARRAWLARESLMWSASYDDLSGLLNRRAFEDQMDRILRMAVRQQRSLCLLCIDIDHFKRVNDNHGHLAGDEVIRCVGEELRIACQRPLDLAGRMGGEEFLIAFYEVDAAQALVLAERVRHRIRALTVDPGSAEPIRVTASIGAAVGVPTAGTRMRDFMCLADRLLYQAKSEGRDRVVLGPLDAITAQTANPVTNPTEMRA